MAADVACCCASSWATRVGRSRASETADPAVMPVPNTAATTSMALYAGGIRSMICVTMRLLRRYCPGVSDVRYYVSNPHLGGVTMLRRVSVLALALALAACGDDEPDVLDPQDLRILIVRGDGQVSEVAPS